MAAEKYDTILDLKVDEIRKNVELLVKMVAIQQDTLSKLEARFRRYKSERQRHAAALRNLRLKLTAKQNYIRELEMFARLPPSQE